MKRGAHEFAPAKRFGDNRTEMRLVVGVCAQCGARVRFALTARVGLATSLCGHVHASWRDDTVSWRGMERAACYDR